MGDMKIDKTNFEDLYIINYKSFNDKRGEFIKTIHAPSFIEMGLEWQFEESFYSISKKNVIRGMHFQVPPNSHSKLVYVVEGTILDVVLDLRTSAKTFGSFFSIELSAENRNAIYIGKGFAHGFLSLDEKSIVEYHITTVQNKISESGVKWSSFGFDWGIQDPIISDRDDAFENFNKKMSYFI
jgi:dTDP-4-dehydrorhamnose 3,5-epimerase